MKLNKEETILQKQVMCDLSLHGYNPLRMNVGLYYTKNLIPIHIGIVGTPDLLVLKNDGKCFWIEMKTQKGVLSSDQINFHNFLKGIGHHVYIVKNIKELENVYEKEK
ncbi:MAG: VRR-NUC domain-containing protein [Coprobacillus sp.]|nr:VRR-NUC domain-containing protein [Coprobacillus sp.]